MSELDDLVSMIDAFKGQPIRSALYEIEKLREIRDWAIKSLGLDYQPGDRVQIVTPPDIGKNSGWRGYEEVLAAGRTGTAGEIHFVRDQWYCDLHVDRGWSCSERQVPDTLIPGRWNTVTDRYWWGPADETPPGMKPPSRFDQDRHPEGRVKIFMLRALSLAHAGPDYDASGLPRTVRAERCR